MTTTPMPGETKDVHPKPVQQAEPGVDERVAVNVPDRSSILRPLDEAPLQSFHITTILLAACGWIQAGWDVAMFNNMTVILGFTKFYDHGSVIPRYYLDSLNVTLYAGTLIGQLFWGWAGDYYGRKNMFFKQSLVVFVGVLLSATSTWGRGHAVVGIWCIWRVLLGFGLGGEYSLTAVLTAEFSNRRWRGMLVSLCWAFQGIGFVISAALGLLIVTIYKDALLKCTDGHACEALDDVWRICLGTSSIPVVFIFCLRNWLPESPRFTLFNRANTDRAQLDVQKTLASERNNGAYDISLANPPTADGLWGYLHEPLVARRLFGCMATWFLRDITFISMMIWGPFWFIHGFGLHGAGDHAAGDRMFNIWHDQFLAWLMYYIFAVVVGSFAGWGLIDWVGRKPLQACGFAAVSFFLGMAALLMPALGPREFVLLIMIAFMLGNAGPFLTAFVVPAELFKTQFRCQCHSLAAAAGKMGALTAFLGMDRWIASGNAGTRYALSLLSVLSLLGILVTALIPETKNRSLEELCGEFEPLCDSSPTSPDSTHPRFGSADNVPLADSFAGSTGTTTTASTRIGAIRSRSDILQLSSTLAATSARIVALTRSFRGDRSLVGEAARPSYESSMGPVPEDSSEDTGESVKDEGKVLVDVGPPGLPVVKGPVTFVCP